MPTRKNKNTKSLIKTRLLKPEVIFTVKKQKSKVNNKTTHKRKKPIHLKRLSIFTSVPNVYSTVIIFISIFIAVAFVCNANIYTHKTVQKADSASVTAYFDKDTLQRLRLIGNDRYYPSEIINYYSAPSDLQAYMVQDYKKLKTQCIVNGEFAGPIEYEVVNVVYDSFAKLSKTCGGTDTNLLAKISNKWTIVSSGNDAPLCSDVNAFALPKGIAMQCRNGLILYPNPNP